MREAQIGMKVTQDYSSHAMAKLVVGGLLTYQAIQPKSKSDLENIKRRHKILNYMMHKFVEQG